MKNIIRWVTISLLIGCFPFVAHGEDKNEFPWLMTPYKHAHLTAEQKQIYLNAYFETMGFILYSYLDHKDFKAMKQLNAWVDCVTETKQSVSWSPDLGWLFGKNLDKSGAYVLYNEVYPLICEEFTEKAGTQILVLVPGNGNSVKKLGMGSYFPPEFLPKVSVREDDHFLFPSRQEERFLKN